MPIVQWKSINNNKPQSPPFLLEGTSLLKALHLLPIEATPTKINK